jgi:hypothetical protein
MAVLWEVALCCLVDTDRCFTGAYCLLHEGKQGVMMEAASPSETLDNIYQTARCHIP